MYKDEILKELVKTSLTNNYDLAVAVARVEQARQVAAEARSQYFPTVNSSLINSYGHNQFIISPGSNAPGAQGFFQGIASATWEADVWGRIRRTNESARAQYLATEEARRGVMLTLASDVSQAYFELLGLRFQLDIAKRLRNRTRQPSSSSRSGCKVVSVMHSRRRAPLRTWRLPPPAYRCSSGKLR